MKPAAVGGLIALAVVLVDQIVKAGVLSHFGSPGVDPSPLGPFLNLTLQMNRGISFSLFARDFASAQVALLALTLAVVGLLTWWLFRSRSVLPAAGLGLISAALSAMRSIDLRTAPSSTISTCTRLAVIFLSSISLMRPLMSGSRF